jgi:hypothetical protein
LIELNMPSQMSSEEQLYDALRNGKALPFSFTTGGVKYKAVLQHKET